LNTRRNQNSILVLATLGVYLGLVLVGATPQVLAQAAMTRQFNVKDEIQFAEDLDKKPPEDVATESDDSRVTPPGDRLVASSIDKFLSGFALSGAASCSVHIPETLLRLIPAGEITFAHNVSRSHLLGMVLTASHFARAGLDPLRA
jgi:hypothetical protein